MLAYGNAKAVPSVQYEDFLWAVESTIRSVPPMIHIAIGRRANLLNSGALKKPTAGLPTSIARSAKRPNTALSQYRAKRTIGGNMSDWSDQARRALRGAGWTPGRCVDVSDLKHWLEHRGFIVSEAAERFLSEFFDLVFDISGPGISVARAPFHFDPRLLDGEDDRFNEWGAVLGETLSPLGELENGRFFLGITGSGEVYLVETWLASYGRGRQALENLICGVRPTELHFADGE